DFPGTDDFAKSGHDNWKTSRRNISASQKADKKRSHGSGSSIVEGCPNPGSGKTSPRISSSVEWRHASESDDGDGDRMQACIVDCGRTNDGAGCNNPGANP